MKQSGMQNEDTEQWACGEEEPETCCVLFVGTHMEGGLMSGLQSAGIRSVHVSTGKQALEFASRRQVDLVLMELSFPDMDAEQLIRRLRSMRASLPLAILTADRESFPSWERQLLQADAYLSQFRNSPEVGAWIREIIEIVK